MKSPVTENTRPLGLIWVNCPPSVVVTGLVHALEEHAQIHLGDEPPEQAHTAVIVQASEQEVLKETIESQREANEEAPILAFDAQLDLPLASKALKLGASGFIHAGMKPDQLVRAVTVSVTKGELVAPRELIGFLITQEEPAAYGELTARQREILELVVEGLSNAEIANRLFLSESTIKQHLRAAYKRLGVSNRTEAANLIRRLG